MSDTVGQDGRGQSELLGIVLLFAIILTVSMTVVVVGSQALDDARAATDAEDASVTFSELQSSAAELRGDASGGKVSEVSFTEGLSRSVNRNTGPDATIPEDSEVSVEPNTGWIQFTVTTADGNVEDTGRIDLGQIKYTQGDRNLAYQGGGVFAKNSGTSSSTVQSPPPISYQHRNGVPTLNFPIETISTASGTDLHSNDLTLTSSGSTRYFPTSNVQNPLKEGATIEITIQSEFYRAWGSHFESQTAGAVTYDDTNNQVTLQMDGPEQDTETAGPINNPIATESVAQLTNAGQIDSYSSFDGPYPGWRANAAGTIEVDNEGGDTFELNTDAKVSAGINATGDFYVANSGPEVWGPVAVGGTIDIDAGASLWGDVSTEGDLELHSNTGATFGGDVIVGGNLNGPGGSEIQGSLHLHEDAVMTPTEGNLAEVNGDVVIDGTFEFGQSGTDGLTFVGSDSEIIANGDVTVTEGTHDVDIHANGEVTVQSGTINGDVKATSGIDNQGTITGNTDGSAAAPSMDVLREPLAPEVNLPDSASNAISTNKTEIEDDHDNDPDISAIESGGACSAGCNLSAGDYELNEIDLQWDTDETLELNTSNGDIRIYAENGLNVGDRGKINITGDNQVRIYSDGDFRIAGDSAAIQTLDDDGNPTHRATQLMVFLQPSASATFESNSPSFTGVIYGPGPNSPTNPAGSEGAAISVTNDATIYGALVGNIDGYNSGAELHYDEALGGGVRGGGLNIVDNPDADSVAFLSVQQTELLVED